MAIQLRRGAYANFDPAKMTPGEPAIVVSGDPNSSDGKSAYVAFAAGDVKRLATHDDIVNEIESSTEEIAEDLSRQFAEDVQDIVNQAQRYANQASSASSDASEFAGRAATKAQEAAESAEEAAETVATIIDDTLTQTGKAADAKATGDRFESIKTAHYPDLTVGTAETILADTGVVDKVPYLFRQSGGGVAVGDREKDTVVGATVGWNQLCNSASVTVQNGHKCLTKIGSTWAIIASTGAAITGLTSGSSMVIDLTTLFGSTIADYIYTLEQATAGAGVAWFRKLFPKDYYPYHAASLESAKPTAHVMRDENENVIGNYPLGGSELRGILKLDSANNIYADGDRYTADGVIERRYGLVDLGTLYWTYDQYDRFVATITSIRIPSANNVIANWIICPLYDVMSSNDVALNANNMSIGVTTSGYAVIRNTSYTYVADFKAAMSGVMMLYELAEPVTEESTPYAEVQIVDDFGTEEYVDTREVPIPVGHETTYPTPIATIPEPPDTTGTYTLRAVVTASGTTYEWISG